jgi:hypothetical protein
MKPRKVSSALTMVGIIGLTLQFIFYPKVNGRLGNVRIFRLFSIAFPIAYCLVPYLVIIPPNSASAKWVFTAMILTIHTAGRIFVLPVTIALLNNCASDASVLGTIHGLGQTVTAIFRTAGPVSTGYLFGISLDWGIIGMVWWHMALVAMFGWIASLFIRERHTSLQGARSPRSTRKSTPVGIFKDS